MQKVNLFVDVSENYMSKWLQVKLDPDAQLTGPRSVLSPSFDSSFL